MPKINYYVSENEIIQLKKRRYARTQVTRALKKGELVKPECCQLCDEKSRLNAHHTDYGKPMQVIWLCVKCHGMVHKKGHELNPENIEQSPLPSLGPQYLVPVTVLVPNSLFLCMLKHAKTMNLSISKQIKKLILKEYEVQSNQLELNLVKRNDHTSHARNKRVPLMVPHEGALLQSKEPQLQKVRGKGNNSVQGMGERLLEVLQGHGNDAPGLQRHRAAG